MSQLASIARTYVERGFRVVRIPAGKKFPTHDGWNTPGGYFEEPAEAERYFAANDNDNLGVVLGPSRLCSLDIDHTDHARLLFAEFGVDIDELARCNPTVVGNPARFRVMFTVPDGVELTRHALSWPNEENLALKHTVFEFRAGPVQDVLPPSIHPDTCKPYSWRTSPKAAGGIHPLPESLLAMWFNWEVFKPQGEAVCPWAPKEQPRQAKPRQRPVVSDAGGPSLIDQFNDKHSLVELLARYGYRKSGKRWLSPHSQTKLPGVILLDDDRCYVHHASDPLCSDHPVDCFDLWTQYEHGGDYKRSTKAAAELLGLNRRQPPPPMPRFNKDTGEIYDDEPPAYVTECVPEDLPDEPDADAAPAPVPVPTDGDRGELETPPLDGGLVSFVKPLGHNQGVFFYWSAGLKQVVAMSHTRHTDNGLMAMAAADVWAAFFPKGKDGTDFDTKAAANWLMEACRLRGVYDPNRLRGRGAWLDDGRVILHLGDRLLVDGGEADMARLRSAYVYQANYRLPGPLEPITRAEVQRLEDLATRVRWEVPASGYLLLGFLTLAPICGALRQRPGVWITGASGSGKSTVMQDFIKPLLGDMLHFFQGATSTEAGIRQTLAGDALPVAIDEFEMDDKRHQDRVQAILELARGSYSDDGAKTAKGSAGGSAQLFVVRSMFVMASINVGIKAKADSNRIAVLAVRNPQKAESSTERDAIAKEWADFQAALQFITPELGRRMLARTVSRLPLVRQNVRVFVTAAGAFFGSQRLGDTYGTLLGGAWSLLHDEAATPEAALAMLKVLSWESYTESAQEDEAEGALSGIMQVMVGVENSSTRANMSVGELIKISCRGQGVAGIYRDDADTALGRYGIKVKGERLLIANKSRLLERALADTPIAVNWKNYLRRLGGAVSEPAVYFAPGVTARATSLPISLVQMGE